MLNRGLCITCTFDKTCVFSRHFPVLYCEEFNSDDLNGKFKSKKQGSYARGSRVAACVQEESIQE